MRNRCRHCKCTACICIFMTIVWITMTGFIQLQRNVKGRPYGEGGNDVLREIMLENMADYPDGVPTSNYTDDQKPQNMSDMLPWLQIKPVKESIAVPPLLMEGVGNYVALATNASLQYGNHRSETAYLTIGIPTVSRQWGNEFYLYKTLESLIANASPTELKHVIFVVFLSDFNATWNAETAVNVRKRYTTLCDDGTIQIVRVPYDIYPDFSKINRTLGDSKERTIWRSKQNIDFSFMMLYSRTLSAYYMQLEDDVISSANYLRDIRMFIDSQKQYWACIEVSHLGFIGKIFKTKELPKFASFFLAFYDSKPCDILLGQVYSLLGQKKPIHSKESLFQHIGKVSSLRHKIMPAIDQQFKFIGKSKLSVAQVPKGDNPPAVIRSNMKPADDFRHPEHAYSNDTSYFRAKTLRKDSYFNVIYRRPLRIERIMISTGDDRNKKEILQYGDVYIGEFQTKSLPCSNAKKVGPLVDGDFDSFLQGCKLPKLINCISIKSRRSHNQPCIIREISVLLKK